MKIVIILLMVGILFLLSIFRKPIRRAAYLLGLRLRDPLRSLHSPGRAEFVNIGEGTHEHGQITLLPTATATSRYLLWKRTAGTINCVLCTTNNTPMGSSDDYPDNSSYLTQGIAVKIFGVFKGTTRVITDGTCTDGNPVKCGANGQATLWTNGTDSGTNPAIGYAIISPDSTANAGDAIEIVPICPAIYFR
jgi:hypothetical protein